MIKNNAAIFGKILFYIFLSHHSIYTDIGFNQ